MSEMRNRVAMSICGATGICVCMRDGRDPAESLGTRCCAAIDEAHEAIIAMREPTKAMLDAAEEVNGENQNVCADIWETMIDAALKD